MTWQNLGQLTLTKDGDYVPIPLENKGGTVSIRVPEFATQDTGTYEIGVFGGPDDPGFIGKEVKLLAPYTRYITFTVPPNLPNPHLGMVLLTHPQLNDASISLVPQFHPPIELQDEGQSQSAEWPWRDALLTQPEP